MTEPVASVTELVNMIADMHVAGELGHPRKWAWIYQEAAKFDADLRKLAELERPQP